jgi:hypothetical protein
VVGLTGEIHANVDAGIVEARDAGNVVPIVDDIKGASSRSATIRRPAPSAR